ncbi:MAG: hypothetical protein SO132_03120 [Candidatus Enteromonas sp.]|nr:hypothetical protein [Candidatus Enteromonas sp.]
MKKKVTIFSILGLLFLAGGLVLLYFLPTLMGDKAFFKSDALINFANIGNVFSGMFSSLTSLGTILFISVSGVLLFILVLHLCFLIGKKHPLALLEFFGFLVEAVIFDYALIAFFYKGFFTETPFGAHGPFGVKDGGLIALSLDYFNNKAFDIWWFLLTLVPALLILIGLIFSLIAVIADIAYCASTSKEKDKVEESKTAPSNVLVVHDEDTPNQDDFISDLEKADTPSSKENEIAPATPVGDITSRNQTPAYGLASGQSIAGPLLVQYINTYAPENSKTEEPASKKGAVPVSEIQGAISGEKHLSADDIRKIVHEELSNKEKPNTPVIVSVPAPITSEEKSRGVSADEVRSIFADELSKVFAKEGEIIVEPEPQKSLTPEDIKKIIRDELDSKKEEEAAKVVEKPVEQPTLSESDVREVIKQELSAFRTENENMQKKKLEEEENARKAEEEKAKALQDARRFALDQLRKEEEEKKKRLEEENLKKQEEEKRLEAYRLSEERRKALEEEVKKPTLTATDIRQIFSEEFAKLPKEETKPVEDSNKLTPEMIREIIKQELSTSTIKEAKVAPTNVVIKDEVPTPEPKKEEVVPPTPHITVVVNNPAPAVETKKEVIEEKSVEPIKRVVGAVNPDLPPHDKIIRIPFPTRMLDADKDMKSNYSELKSEILSYGVKSRISNSGDTFRLHKITFVKITIAGKSLKLYFGLNPKDYANTPLPVQDVSHKNIYKDIPLVFKVKSELSLRRAKQLIADVMDKNGLEQGKIVPHNWAAELKDYKPSDKDDDQADE